jgi:signal transduction histidine kinase
MRPAAELPAEQAELYAVTFYACLVGLIAYLSYIPLFLAIGAPQIAGLNVAVVVLFAVAESFVIRGRIFLGMAIAATWVAGHAWFTALTLGAGAAFQLHVILALELGLLFAYVPLRIRLVYAAIFVSAYVGLVFALSHTTPTVELTRDVTQLLQLLNSAIFAGVTVLIATFYAWSVQKNREAREGLLDRLQDNNETLRVAHAELARARDEAQTASKAKSMFLANMSHELRTPLNAIIGYGEMIQEDADASSNQDLSDQVARICGAGRHLLALINEILDLAKIEAGKMECEATEFELAGVAREVVDTVRPLSESRGNRLAVDIDEAVGRMCTDSTKVRQILLNLMSNAAKFTENGEVSLVVAADERAGRAGVRLEVGDTGIGIPDDKLVHIFDEFSQGDSSTTRRYGGTGLGLAITARFVGMLGGTIDVESEEGQGSRFEVWLPLRLPQAR